MYFIFLQVHFPHQLHIFLNSPVSAVWPYVHPLVKDVTELIWQIAMQTSTPLC